jgi:hypothetical protein
MPDTVDISDPTADLDWPQKAGQVKPLIGETLSVLLTNLNMNTTDAMGPLNPPSASVSTIESGMTSGAKLLAFLVTLAGGASAVTVAVSRFWHSSSASVQTGAVLAFGSIIVATVLALALIVGADLRARGVAMAGLYEGRAGIATSFMSRLPIVPDEHATALAALSASVTAMRTDLESLSNRLPSQDPTIDLREGANGAAAVAGKKGKS